jgi:ABC-type multidrug transport system fused ATPase/permease subunit
VLVGSTALVAVLTPGKISPGLVGLALAYAVSITGLLNWLVRQATETETYLACVERVKAYAELPVEAPPIVAETRPPPGWPHAGAISIRNLTARYRPGLPPVLSGVSVDIPAGCRVGVCGRTGSGKSSLMLCLFRILEAEAEADAAATAGDAAGAAAGALTTNTAAAGASSTSAGKGAPAAKGNGAIVNRPPPGKGNGAILIDGIDISTLGLDDLRSRLAIIPQDPVLFAATLRCVHTSRAPSCTLANPSLFLLLPDHPFLA